MERIRPSHLDEFDVLRLLRQHGSLRQAAAACGMTPQALSQRLLQLGWRVVHRPRVVSDLPAPRRRYVRRPHPILSQLTLAEVCERIERHGVKGAAASLGCTQDALKHYLRAHGSRVVYDADLEPSQPLV